MNFSLWEGRTVTHIDLAVFVREKKAKLRHADRPNHGLVLNEPDGVRRYEFDSGMTMPTVGDTLFYLPKGSSYRVVRDPAYHGSCWAINFDLSGEGADVPFALNFRDAEPLRRDFTEAARAWREKRPFWQERIYAALYDIIARAAEETALSYLPTGTRTRIAAAEEIIARRFTENSLSVAELAAACGISEAYFRRIFLRVYGVTPAAYIARLRLERAKELLFYGQMRTAETAARCGYGDPAYFCREFRRRTGMTPGEYRARGEGGV